MRRLFQRFPFLVRPRFLLGLYVLIGVVVTLHRLLLPHYVFNNFAIFRSSFINLVHSVDLYALHPGQHDDLFKYSPTFALLMAPFYALPVWAGILLWNGLNVLAPLWAVRRLRVEPEAKAFVLLFILPELVTSVQNAQSNGLVTGMLIGVFASLERDESVLAALLVCLGFYTKLFGAAAGILFLFHPRKARFVMACAGWMLLLAALPLLVTPPHTLASQYGSWLHLLGHDAANQVDYSVMTLTQRWFGVTAPDAVFLVPGLALLLLPLVRREQWSTFGFRLLFLSALMIWVVIFNHKAESPTYIIAVSGAALWGLTQPPSATRTTLLWFVFVLTGLAATDVFPPWVRGHLIKPYALKALPCILLWVVATWQLFRTPSFARWPLEPPTTPTPPGTATAI